MNGKLFKDCPAVPYWSVSILAYVTLILHILMPR